MYTWQRRFTMTNSRFLLFSRLSWLTEGVGLGSIVRDDRHAHNTASGNDIRDGLDNEIQAPRYLLTRPELTTTSRRWQRLQSRDEDSGNDDDGNDDDGSDDDGNDDDGNKDDSNERESEGMQQNPLGSSPDTTINPPSSIPTGKPTSVSSSTSSSVITGVAPSTSTITQESSYSKENPSATTELSTPSTTETVISTASETSARSSTTPIPATTTDQAAIISSIQESASKAIEDARSSASSSAQSVIDAAKSANAETSSTAVASSVNSIPTTQGSNLTPGQISGVVISIAIVASILSALSTYFLMRRRQKHQEAVMQSKFETDSPPDPRNRVANPSRSSMSSFHMFTAPPIAHNYDNNTDFIPDVKQRLPPPPEAEHPAMSTYALTRTISMPEPEGDFDPVFPVSPLSSEGESFVAGGGGNKSFESSQQTGLASSGEAVAGHSIEVSLARQQSMSGGKRAQLVRVGSNSSGREKVRKVEKESADPLAMNPVVHAETEWRLFPTSTSTPETAPQLVGTRLAS